MPLETSKNRQLEFTVSKFSMGSGHNDTQLCAERSPIVQDVVLPSHKLHTVLFVNMNDRGAFEIERPIYSGLLEQP
jgi:hypothetical protein